MVATPKTEQGISLNFYCPGKLEASHFHHLRPSHQFEHYEHGECAGREAIDGCGGVSGQNDQDGQSPHRESGVEQEDPEGT